MEEKISLPYSKVNLQTNSFIVNFAKLFDTQIYVYQYSIDFATESGSEKSSDSIDSAVRILKRPLKILFEDYVVSGKMLWSPKYLELTQLVSSSVKSKNLTLKVSYASKFNITCTQFESSVQASAVKQLINVMIQKGMDHKYIKCVNGKYYAADKAAFVDDKKTPLNIWPGFHISGYLTQGPQYTIQIDTCARILMANSVLEVMKGFKSKAEVSNLLDGQLAVAGYGKRETKAITAVDFTKNPATFTFENKKGEKISMMKYYEEKYGIKIKDPKQPLLESKKGQKVEYLIPELFNLSGADEAKINFRLSREVDKYTKFAPKIKMSKINSMKEELAGTCAKSCGILLGRSVDVTGYIIKAPNKKYAPAKPNAKVSVPLESIYLKDWIIVYEAECYDDSEFLTDALMKSAGQLGFKLDTPCYIEIKGTKAWTELKSKILQNLNKSTQVLVLIIPQRSSTEWYENFETLCLSTFGVACQSVKSQTLFKFKEKNPLPLAKNLLEQIACKLGKIIWTTEMPKDLPNDLMIIGADVYHKTNEKKKSCVAVCSTTNASFTKIHYETEQQTSGKEIMLGIGKMVAKCLEAYKAENKKLPQTIIFYRDGVGEGQMEAVLNLEVEAIYKEMHALYGDKYPKFAEIIVTKRISNKFVVKDQNGNLFNPEPGTLVVDGVTTVGYPNFFLTSQKTRDEQGTGTPTHYTIIHNDTNIKMTTFYELTYNLCYNYFTWNGSVKVPAPIQYAHSAALKAGQVLKENKLSEKLKNVPCLV